MKFIYFSKFGQPLIAIPYDLNLPVALKAISCLPSFTNKRKIFKIYAYSLVCLGFLVSKKIFKTKKNKIERLLALFDDLKKNPNLQNTYPVIIWSLVKDRNRLYVHFLNKKGEKCFFMKVSENKDDFLLLKNEFNYLKKITSRNDNFYNVPSPIKFDFYKDYCYLIVRSLDDNLKLFHPSRNKFPVSLSNSIKEGKLTKALDDVYKNDWWDAFLKNKNESISLFNFIKDCDNNIKVNISNVHGDFGSENIFLSNYKFTVIDWERSTKQGPFFVDEIAYWLGCNHTLIKKKDIVTIRKFYEAFEKVSKIDLALALSFLVGAKFDLAIIVSQKFSSHEN